MATFTTATPKAMHDGRLTVCVLQTTIDDCGVINSSVNHPFTGRFMRPVNSDSLTRTETPTDLAEFRIPPKPPPV